jgi:leucyl/phenylalanyl-tRNA--protein transferase
MPVSFLTEELVFPPPEEALEDGLLAVGGDLSTERLLLAYSSGIFPWYSEDSPILWWSPDPRMVLFPADLKVSKSLRQKINSGAFEIRFDCDFDSVIQYCATVERKEQVGTWIGSEMINAYKELHKNGYAHSVETYLSGELVGGLYGVSLGKAFFGESMFYIRADASKIALYHLVEKLKSWNFKLIDVQQETSHLRSLGARPVPREKFLDMLKTAINTGTTTDHWKP